MTYDVRQNLLYIITISFLVGVAIRSIFSLPDFFILSCAVNLLVSLIWCWYRKSHGLIVAALCVFLFICFGVLSFGYKEYQLSQSILIPLEDKSIELVGVVVKEPEDETFTTKLIVEISQLKSEEKIKALTNPEKMIVHAPMKATYEYGETVYFSGKLTKPKNFLNENGREVKYQAMLKKDGIQFEIKNAKFVESKIQDVGTETKSETEIKEDNRSFNLEVWIISHLFEFKNAFTDKHRELLPEPDASLASGILLGEKKSLGKELTDKLRDVGLIHIVVLSGYNIALVVLILQKIGSTFSKRFSYIISGLGVLLFIGMVGGGSTVIRAGVMAFLALGAQMSGRSYNAGRALFAAAAVMVLWNPYILMFDMSFQLSFLATIGIVYVTPLIDLLLKNNNHSIFLSIISTTISTQIVVAPFLLYAMGSLSVIGLVSNVLVLPLVPIIMASTFFVGGLGFVHYFVAIPFAFISHLLFSYMLWIVDLFSSFQFAVIKIQNFSLWMMVLMYLIISSICVYFHKKYSHLLDTNKI